MWKITNIERRRATLDFTSSGQGVRQVGQLYFDGICFANAIELTSWDADVFQTIICEGCGIEHCESKGWLELRRAGEYVVWIPLFAKMLSDEFGLREYAPPDHLKLKGIPVFDRKQYSGLLKLVPKLPEIDRIQPLSASEVVRMLQWEAPANVLGKFPEPVSLNESMIVAVSDDNEVSLQLRRLRRLINLLSTSSSVVLLQLVAPDANVITFYLDITTFPEWHPMVFLRESPQLFFEPWLVVMLAEGNQ